MRLLERGECWCIIGTGKGKRAYSCLVTEERLQEIDANQDEIEEGKSQPYHSRKQKAPDLAVGRQFLVSRFSSLSFSLA